ncbi:MAG: HAD hydrolase-like protein [Candidatus Moranbacteria bacterium]|nr:HAD hydrolase-like protein [Candidatus Moranbacteria bacterium]
MSRRLIIFDFDGTIADTYPVFLAFVSREGFRFDAGEAGELRDLSLREAVKRLGIPDRKLLAFVRKFRRYFRKTCDELPLIEGVSDAIARLHEEGYLLAILSTNDTRNIRKILKREGMWQYFDIVRSERNIFGKARSIRRLVRKVGFAPSATWYVGDEVRDIEAAREAGVRSVAVTWGFNSDAALRASHPDSLVSTPSELSDVFS